MSDCIFAYTKAEQIYPGYINFTREADGSVSVYVRADPTRRAGFYVCGFAADKGQPGRCTPGDDRCNNYCNMAPARGPMRDAPAACEQVDCGGTVKLSLSVGEFAALVAGLSGAPLDLKND